MNGSTPVSSLKREYTIVDESVQLEESGEQSYGSIGLDRRDSEPRIYARISQVAGDAERPIPSKYDLLKSTALLAGTAILGTMSIAGMIMLLTSPKISTNTAQHCDQELLNYANTLPNVIPGDNRTKALNMSALPTCTPIGGFLGHASESVGIGALVVVVATATTAIGIAANNTYHLGRSYLLENGYYEST